MTPNYVMLTLEAMLTVAVMSTLGAAASSRFISQSQQLGVLEGSHVTLRCAVIGLGDDHAVFWNHGGSVLSMNDRVFASHRSVSVAVGDGDVGELPRAAAESFDDDDHVVAYTLRLDSVTLQDEGEYSCQVPSQPSLVQRHRIVINVVPTITDFLPESGSMEVAEGDSVRLMCRATGKPDPVISWTHRPHQIAANSERNVGVGEVLSIDSVTRQDGGLYVCVADNGAGSKSRDFVFDVKYGPLAEVVDANVYVGYDQPAEISCMLRANPTPKVTWIHNDTPINPLDNANVFASLIPDGEKDTSLARLNIYRVSTDDVGNYRCIGSNGFGFSSAGATLIGLPVNVTVLSDGEALYSDRHELAWSVQSLSPLISHQLQLQDLSDSQQSGSNDTPAEWQLMEPSADDVREIDVDDDVRSLTAAAAASSPGVRQFRWTLTGLSANTSYAGLLRATNVFGSSEWSSMFNFDTAATQQAVVTSTAAASGGSAATTVIPARLQRANHHRGTNSHNDGTVSSWSLMVITLLATCTSLRYIYM